MHKYLYFLFMLVVFFLSETILTAPAYADRTTVVLIGVSKTEGDAFSELTYVKNDIKQLIKVFSTCKETQVFVLACEDPFKGNKDIVGQEQRFKYVDLPTKGNIENFLRDTCNETLVTDTLIVYFSGHGMISTRDNQKTFLIASDTKRTVDGDSANEKTAVSAQNIRRIMQKASTNNKILFLDSCHSGGTRGSSLQDKMSAEFLEGGVNGVLTIASCQATQFSGSLASGSLDAKDRVNMSLFTYWLCKGLRGYADGFVDYDGDGSYDMPDSITDTLELVNYINDNMKTYMGVQGILESEDIRQDIVFVSAKKTNHFNLPKVKTPYLEELLADIAEQVVTHVKAQNVDTFDISDFESEYMAKVNKVSYQNVLKNNETYCSNRLLDEIESKLRDTKATNIRLTKNSKEIKGFGFRTNSDNSDFFSEGKLNVSLKNKIVFENNGSKYGYYLINSTLSFSNDFPPLTIKGKVINTKIKTGWEGAEAPAVDSQIKENGNVAEKDQEPSQTTEEFNNATDTDNAPAEETADRAEPETNAVPEANEQADVPYSQQIEPDIPNLTPQVASTQTNDPDIILPEVYFEVRSPDGSISRRNFFRIGDALYIPFDEGEVYRIVFNCDKIQKDIGLRVLIDGKNTLPQEEAPILKKISLPAPKFRVVDSNENVQQNSNANRNQSVVTPSVASVPASSNSSSGNQVRVTPSGRIIETPVPVNHKYENNTEMASSQKINEDSNVVENFQSMGESQVVDNSETMTTENTESDGVNGVADFQKPVVAPLVRLSSARFWVLKNRNIPQAIEGFYKNVNAMNGHSQYNEFQVARVPSTVAVPTEYSSDMGIITIAFYDLVPSPSIRGSVLRTIPGRLYNNVVPVVGGLECGKPLNTLQIRYASQSAIKTFMNSQASEEYRIIRKNVTNNN